MPLQTKPLFEAGLQVSRALIEAIDLSWLPAPSGAVEARELLSGLGFAIARGERVLLTGPSGAGKSTLLRAIAGVLAQTESGVFGGELYVRGHCGLVLQDPANSFVAERLGGEIAFGPENLALPEAEIRSRVDTALAEVALPYGVHRRTTELSGGEAQRMALAGVLALHPEILLLDEPLSMLDPAAAKATKAAIKSALVTRPQTAAIIIDHSVEAWGDVVSRVLVLSADGRLEADLPIADFLGKKASAATHSRASVPLTELLFKGSGQQGAIFVFSGPSGAGKTTMLEQQMAKSYKPADVGWVPQQPELTIVADTVYDSAVATARNIGVNLDLANHLLEVLGFANKLQQNPHQLSGGELRRLALVSALAHRPSILFLDEPTVGQDAETRQTVIQVILSAKAAGIDIKIATHDPELIALADHVFELTLLAQQPAAEPRASNIAPLLALVISIGLIIGSFAITNLIGACIALTAVALATAACWRLLPAQRLKRFVPVLIALSSIWLTNALFSGSGIGAQGFERATVVALRVAFFVLPGVALSSALNAAELAAALVKWVRLPARPAVAAVAALVRLEFLQWQWADVQKVRHWRAFGQKRNPLSRSKEFAKSLFVLLVVSLRSASELAAAMQARSFGEPSAKRRTWVKF